MLALNAVVIGVLLKKNPPPAGIGSENFHWRSLTKIALTSQWRAIY